MSMDCGMLVNVSPNKKTIKMMAMMADCSYVSVNKKGISRGASRPRTIPHGVNMNTKNLVSVEYAARTWSILFSAYKRANNGV